MTTNKTNKECCERCIWSFDDTQKEERATICGNTGCPCHQQPEKEEPKCACGEELCLGGAEVEIGGVCHRPNNPCYVISHPEPKEGDYGMGGGITNCAEPSNEEVTAKNVWVGLSGVCRLNGKPSREWEEEFDETYHIYRIGEWSEQIIPNSCKPTPIKSYIPNLLLSERTALVESIINELESNPNEDGSTSPNIQHWIEVKQRQLKAKFLTRKS